MSFLDPGNWLQNSVGSLGNALGNLNMGVSPSDMLGSLGSFLGSNSIGNDVGSAFSNVFGGGGNATPTGNPGASAMSPADLLFQGPGGGNGAASQYATPTQWPFAVQGQGPLRPGETWDGSADPTMGNNGTSPYGQVDQSMLQQLIKALAGQAPVGPDFGQINQPYQQAIDSARKNATDQSGMIDSAMQSARDQLAGLMKQADTQNTQNRAQMQSDQGAQMASLQAAMQPFATASGMGGGAAAARMAMQQANLQQAQAGQQAQQSATQTARDQFLSQTMNAPTLQGQSAHNILNQNLSNLLNRIGISQTSADTAARNAYGNEQSKYSNSLAQLMQRANTFISGQQQTGSKMGQDQLSQMAMSGDPTQMQSADVASKILFGAGNQRGARSASEALATLTASMHDPKAPNNVDWNGVRNLVMQHYDTNKRMPQDIMSRLASYLGNV